MKITPERQANATRIARVPLGETTPRVTAAYLAAVKGMEADQNRVGVHAFPGLRFQDGSGDDGLMFVHPLALDRAILLTLQQGGHAEDLTPGDATNGDPGPSEVTHAYSPGQARALAYALLVLADEADADAPEVLGG